jgi:hypothetical protein
LLFLTFINFFKLCKAIGKSFKKNLKKPKFLKKNNLKNFPRKIQEKSPISMARTKKECNYQENHQNTKIKIKMGFGH